jgi:multidrug efflux pump subunit AcrB
MLAVTARLEGRDLGRTIDDIKAALAAKLILPQGMILEYGGVYQTQQESFRGLLLVAMAAVLLVFLVLLIEFGEFAVPFSIFIVNLLSLSGVFGALWITGISFNISSFVGIIMIIGIVAENAIFVMHRVHELRLQGFTLDDALVQAGQMRARPILMTTIAATLAWHRCRCTNAATARYCRHRRIFSFKLFSLFWLASNLSLACPRAEVNCARSRLFFRDK